MKLKEGMVIHCKTQEDAEMLLEECSKQGIKTCGNDDATELGVKGVNVWNQCKENTGYVIEKSYRHDGLKIGFSRIKFYESIGYAITNFDDLFKTESKFKVGDKVRVRSGLKLGNYYNRISFIRSMCKYVGVESIIEGVSNEGNYLVNHGNHTLYYSEEMLEKIKEEKKMSKCKIYEMPDYVRDEVKKIIVNNRTVVVILKSGHKGVATCSPQDKFVENVGYQIALLRARINKKEDELKRKKQVLSRITEDPELIAEFPIV